MTRARDIADQQDNLGGAVAPFVAGKNFAINGGFDIWQRSTSSSSVNGYFTADRWYNGGGGTVTISQQTDIPTGVTVQYSQRWLTGASSSFGQFYYALESAIVKPLRGQSMVLSYYIKTAGSHTGNILTAIDYSNSTDALVSQTTGVTEAGDTLYAASSVTSWTRKTVTFTVPTDAVGLRVSIIPDTAQASGVSELLTGVQLEIGSAATPFARAGGSIGGELALCQRYYQVVGGGSNVFPIASGYASAASQYLRYPISFLVEFRTTPTATKNGTWTVSNAAQPQIGMISSKGWTFQLESTAGGIILAHPDSTDDTITFSAEL